MARFITSNAADEMETKGHRFRTRSERKSSFTSTKKKASMFIKRLRGCSPLGSGMQNVNAWCWGRDRMGEKPLFVRREPGRCALRIGDESHSPGGRYFSPIECHCIQEYWPRLRARPLCLIEGIRKIAPRSLSRGRKCRTEIREYWMCPLASGRITAKKNADGSAQSFRKPCACSLS